MLQRAAGQRLADLASRFQPLGLGVTAASVLAVIAHNPEISQAECGHLMSIRRTNLNPIVRRLADRGHVTEEKSEGRSWGLRTTVEGPRLCQQVIAEFESHATVIMGEVPERLRTELLPLLRQLAGAH